MWVNSLAGLSPFTSIANIQDLTRGDANNRNSHQQWKSSHDRCHHALSLCPLASFFLFLVCPHLSLSGGVRPLKILSSQKCYKPHCFDLCFLYRRENPSTAFVTTYRGSFGVSSTCVAGSSCKILHQLVSCTITGNFNEMVPEHRRSVKLCSHC